VIFFTLYLSRKEVERTGSESNQTRAEGPFQRLLSIIRQMQARHPARSFVGILRVWLVASADAPMALRIAARPRSHVAAITSKEPL
jgi:hypothetical protein